MQLVIAEKPSVARDLARVLGVRPTGQNALVGAKLVITWCIGHLVELEEPAAYDSRWKAWRMDTLPMLPTTFKLRAASGTKDQLRVVRDYLRDRRFTEVVNACDAGREGELIFRYVHEWAGSRLPVRRLWISSLTDEAIRQGFATLRPGREYDALGDAARCRSEADWVVGMNATRAVTLRFRTQERGATSALPPVYSIGRVQTPTLAILVRREQAITAFKPEDYWEVRGSFRAAQAGTTGTTPFTASWFVKAPAQSAGDKKPVTRFHLRQMADDVVSRATVHGSAALPSGPVVEHLSQRQSREAPPPLFDLTSLQRTANRRYGLSAKATLEAAQALYEKHKVLTYPRTDSRHLPRDQVNELPRLLGGLRKHEAYAAFVAPLLSQIEQAEQANAASPFARLKRVFDDSKVHDHHAIIPTGKLPPAGALGRDEQRLFDLVVRRFLGAFHPDAEFALTEAIVRVGSDEPLQAPAGRTRPTAPKAPPGPGVEETADREADTNARLKELPPLPDRFVARGKVRLAAGWQAVAGLDERRATGRPERADRSEGGETEDGTAEATLPPLASGQRLDGQFEALARQTRPPPHHTEATLLGAMESAGREMEDEELRAAMKDTGLGTPATRAATIETLVKRGFIAREGRQVIATPTGMDLIERLPVPTLASPELTGAWEARLARIARGQDTRTAFMADIARYVEEMTAALRGAGPAPSQGTTKPTTNTAPPDSRAKPQTPSQALPKAPPKAAPHAELLPCPRCRQGTLVAGHRGWGCSRWREGCAFVIWFQLGGRPLTEAQLRDLITKGKTRKTKWPANSAAPGAMTGAMTGATFVTGRLVLDVNGSREQGGARLAPET